MMTNARITWKQIDRAVRARDLAMSEVLDLQDALRSVRRVTVTGAVGLRTELRKLVTRAIDRRDALTKTVRRLNRLYDAQDARVTR